jgi:phenylacetate-CoA ligase
MRIKGWMGRADQTTKVRGMFVHPHQVAEIVRRHPELRRARLVVSQVDGNDAMQLLCEAEVGIDQEAIARTIRDITKLRGDVANVPANSLPNDGKVIEDQRKIA